MSNLCEAEGLVKVYAYLIVCANAGYHWAQGHTPGAVKQQLHPHFTYSLSPKRVFDAYRRQACTCGIVMA